MLRAALRAQLLPRAALAAPLLLRCNAAAAPAAAAWSSGGSAWGPAAGRPLHAAVTCCQPPAAPPAAPAKPKAPAIPPVKRITRDDVEISFARSSGAGGQNVNKVNTKVDMRLKLDSASWLDPEIAEAVRRAEKRRINKEGELVLQSQRTRSQADNVEDALAKLQEILDAAWKAIQPIEEDPEKAKALKKQLERGNERRLEGKKMQGDKKKQRRAKIEW